VIYVIAAYTITLCALALYGVSLQHRGRMFTAEPGTQSQGATQEDSTKPADDAPKGFNLGAALLSPLWMWSHGMRGAGAVLFTLYAAMLALAFLEMWTPFLFVAIVPLAACAVLGVVGNRIALNYRGAESLSTFSKSQLPWATGGVLLFAFVLPWAWYFVSADAGLS
jgi:hypothetical protein